MSSILSREQGLDSDTDEFDEDFSNVTPGSIRQQRYAPPLSQLLSTPVSEVHVGTGHVKVFHIHQGLLRLHSEVFNGRLGHKPARKKERTIFKLPNDDHYIFATFAQWMYTGESFDPAIIADYVKDVKSEVKPSELDKESEGKISKPIRPFFDTIKDIPSKNPSARHSDDADHFVMAEEDIVWLGLLILSYPFANKIQAPGFKDHILNEITLARKTIERLPSLDLIRYVYRKTSDENDPLRRFCISVACSGNNLGRNLGDPEFIRLCEDIKPFGSNVLRRCGQKIKKVQEK